MVRNRNREIRRVRAGELLAHPANHRLHPPAQKAALEGILKEVGFVGTLVACQLPDGRLRLIDGHLRQESLRPDDEVDVTIVDLDAEERDKILATHDAVGAMAEIDRDKLEELIAGIRIESPAIRAMLDEVAARADSLLAADDQDDDGERRSLHVRESWQVVAICRDEEQQHDVYELLSARGVKCRLLAL
jgi:hypothetical protein